ncbi:response regulator transcription factor [Crocinitomicaceae bacterium CZZ-1]|uniref:Response regulator transcription factor n=1 Tax=Taishania pollutisoli TaxID=2766479 RepID=A0A8J6P474_9FLAO|nr:LytTR family DNA-binding domain-containing protein [Taishania pollutisoli]MBC9811207.1 response regulator transcription factor [Taishania pollutisoli]MBX2947877.1 response regulator transcription factor [Crocinitomicaceae bacterium]NGF74991.1 response regulator transcription factor [Fluviicola sp. SGL-29]
MRKALIIDDENRTRDLIAKMINSFGLDIEAIPAGENVQSGIRAIEEHRPDIVFLDIQMPDGTGFDLLKAIPDKNFEVIFITAHEEFAIKAIKFSALDYILKPVDPEELKAAVERALAAMNDKRDERQFEALQNNISAQQKRRLVLKTQESVHVVDLDQIIRCESDRNYTSFYLTEGRKILVSKTLKEFETLLIGYNFIRVQQSHLINLDYVDRYNKGNGGSVVMRDGSEVPLSPAKREIFFKILENL